MCFYTRSSRIRIATDILKLVTEKLEKLKIEFNNFKIE